MREILFRAKTIENNQWVEGYFVYIPCGRFLSEEWLIQTIKEDGRIGQLHTVYERTVEQFTGLTDKNGKKIFEGDIICALVNEMEETSEFMELGISDKMTRVPTGNKIQAFWSVEWKTFSGSVGWRVYGKDRRFNRPFTPNMIFNCKCEVIGNIHDNPDLLKDFCSYGERKDNG